MQQQTIKLDDWQKEIFDYKGDIVLCTGRQVGKTMTFAHKAAQYLIDNDDSQIIVVSLTEDQAQLMIVMILQYLEWNHKSKIALGHQNVTKSKVTLKSGSRVIARPVGNTGDAVRGFTGDVLIIDECSRMPSVAFAAMIPTLLTTGGEIWICSTPFGREGYFWDCYRNDEKQFKVFHINSEKVMRERPLTELWTEERKQKALAFLEKQKAMMSVREYGQEYLALFLEDMQQYFSDDLIAARFTLKRPVRANPEGHYFMGCDIGRLGGDPSTWEIIQKHEGKIYKHVESLSQKNILTTQTEAKILDLDRLWNCNQIGIDAGSGSLGVGIFDHLMLNDQVKRKIQAMNNRQISINREDPPKKQRIFKEDMYENLLGMMERKEIDLLDDDELRLSFKSVQWELVQAPNKVTKVRIFGKDTHHVEGVVRAAQLAKEKNLNIWISYF